MKIIPNHCAFVAGNSNPPRAFAEGVFEKLSTEEITTRTGKIIFKQGDDPEIQSMNTFNLSESSEQIYNKMLIQIQIYDQLMSFNTNYREQIKDLSDELKSITIIMKSINDKFKINQDPKIKRIPFKNFCNGVNFALNNLRELLRSIRNFIRDVNDIEIERKLLFINITLQSQFVELQEIRQECK